MGSGFSDRVPDVSRRSISLFKDDIRVGSLQVTQYESSGDFEPGKTKEVLSDPPKCENFVKN